MAAKVTRRAGDGGVQRLIFEGMSFMNSLFLIFGVFRVFLICEVLMKPVYYKSIPTGYMCLNIPEGYF